LRGWRVHLLIGETAHVPVLAAQGRACWPAQHSAERSGSLLRLDRYADDCNIYVRSEKAGHRVMANLTRFTLYGCHSIIFSSGDQAHTNAPLAAPGRHPPHTGRLQHTPDSRQVLR
jgi:hypothetical protein